MEKVEPTIECRNCGRPFPAGKLDDSLWCRDCRRVLIRRAALVARIASMLVALGMVAWIHYFGSQPRLMLFYMVTTVAAYYFTYKLTQRVAFEIIRARGVKPRFGRPSG